MVFKWGKKCRGRNPIFDHFTKDNFFLGLQKLSFQTFSTFTRHQTVFHMISNHIIHTVLWKHISPLIPVKLLINQLSDRMCVRACHQYAWQIVDLWSATNLKRDSQSQAIKIQLKWIYWNIERSKPRSSSMVSSEIFHQVIEESSLFVPNIGFYRQIHVSISRFVYHSFSLLWLYFVFFSFFIVSSL